jgi:site-specific recombinase XerD
MNIKEAVSEFSDYLVGKRSEHTRRIYSRGVDLFCDFIFTHNIDIGADTNSLDVKLFVRFPTYLQTLKLSKGSVGVYMAGVKNFHEWLIREELVSAPDYAQTLRLQGSYRDAMRKRESKMVRFPKKGEAEVMVETAEAMSYDTPLKERNYALVCFLYSSGCRNSEAANLKVGEIDQDEQSAIVTGKGSKERRVYFDKTTLLAIREYWRVRGWSNPDDPVFARHDKGAGRKKHKHISTRTIDYVVEEICAAAGIQRGKFTPHYFRHAFAIKMLRETGNLALVQDLMGHENANSTRVYAKIYPDELRDVHHKVFE